MKLANQFDEGSTAAEQNGFYERLGTRLGTKQCVYMALLLAGCVRKQGKEQSL